MARASLPGVRAPAAGFEQPFEMLEACHDRVRRSLALLQRLHAHVAAQGADADARQAAHDVLRYFDVAAPAHHEDEERHVVPALRALGHDAVAQQLLDDHERIRGAWGVLRPWLRQLAGGEVPPNAAFGEAVQRFVALHDSHLALEEGQAFAPARGWTEAQGQGDAMGREMAGRRGVRR